MALKAAPAGCSFFSPFFVFFIFVVENCTKSENKNKQTNRQKNKAEQINRPREIGVVGGEGREGGSQVSGSEIQQKTSLKNIVRPVPLLLLL